MNETQKSWQKIFTATKARDKLPYQQLVEHLTDVGLPGYISQGIVDWWTLEELQPAEAVLAEIALMTKVIFQLDVTGEEEEKMRLMEETVLGENKHFGKKEMQ